MDATTCPEHPPVPSRRPQTKSGHNVVGYCPPDTVEEFDALFHRAGHATGFRKCDCALCDRKIWVSYRLLDFADRLGCIFCGFAWGDIPEDGPVPFDGFHPAPGAEYLAYNGEASEDPALERAVRRRRLRQDRY